MSPEVAISKHGRSVIQKLRKKITVVAIDERLIAFMNGMTLMLFKLL
jgi:hypothetical protein